MNNRRYTLSADDVRELKRIRRTISAGKTSQRPVPTRRRNRGTRGGSSLRWGEATTTISAATGWAAADRGSFTIQFYDDSGDPDGDPVDGENLYPSSFDDASVCCVDTKFTPVRLVSVACDLMPEE